ncbi:PTS cellobiose transporter subunit IIB [Siculibacillus lacustris]|uniref:PTS cellobiose transporter subunit IIB n=1 Tax=Siculibacillus lacustris TaxID=1549641 RepID=A0A4Q9VEP2_9HYPH|nr:PTS glucitol/sorbitol transporter subunit IIA [Siculibacillus lacustris]TBW33279.1 PTS cellobiose transporter subunit IIB [Siculibacillus lacustris]
MSAHLKTEIIAVGPDVAELVGDGVLILFGADAPPELAEVSVLHAPLAPIADEAPVCGTPITIGPVTTTITAVGPTAWKKAGEIGHVVFNFNGATTAERPGEICAGVVDTAVLTAALKVGQTIAIG